MDLLLVFEHFKKNNDKYSYKGYKCTFPFIQLLPNIKRKTLIIKEIIILLLLLCNLTSYGQKDSAKPLDFDIHEIQIFTGLTSSGTHILKLDKNSLMVKMTELSDPWELTTKLINFRELKDSDLKDFRKNFSELLKYLNEFNYKTYNPLTEKNEIVVIDGDTLTREFLISSHDLGTRILIIDENFESHFIRYYFCEEELDELVDKVNNLIPR